MNLGMNPSARPRMRGRLRTPGAGADDPQTIATVQADPRVIDGTENSNGVADLGSFFAKCNVSVNTTFFVIPLSASQITDGERSIRFCP